MRYLPAYSSDLNPIEQAFSKLKMALRKGAARTVTTLLNSSEGSSKTFAPEECVNYFRHDRMESGSSCLYKRAHRAHASLRKYLWAKEKRHHVSVRCGDSRQLS